MEAELGEEAERLRRSQTFNTDSPISDNFVKHSMNAP